MPLCLSFFTAMYLPFLLYSEAIEKKGWEESCLKPKQLYRTIKEKKKLDIKNKRNMLKKDTVQF